MLNGKENPGMRKKRPTKLKRRVFRSYLTSTVSITLILFLLGLMTLLIQNAGRLSEYVRENVGFTLVLHDQVSDAELLRLQKILNANPAVKTTEYLDKEDAAVSLAEDLGEDFVDFLGFNPLFSSIEVKLYASYMTPDSLMVGSCFRPLRQLSTTYSLHSALLFFSCAALI